MKTNPKIKAYQIVIADIGATFKKQPYWHLLNISGLQLRLRLKDIMNENKEKKGTK